MIRRVAALLCMAGLAAQAAPASADSTAAAAAPRAETVVLNVMGDLAYPDGWGGWKYVESQKHLLYRQIQPILDSADLNFVNVECPITTRKPSAVKTYSIRCKPEQIPYFVDAGFNLLSLANNHSLDAGNAGVTDTIVHLEQASSPERPLWWAGTGATSLDAIRPARITVPGKNLVIAFFAVANNSGKGIVAGLHDKELPARIAEAALHADIVIVSAHHGPEYHHAPWPWTVERYHELIDAGATLVLGHHAHVVQGVERYGKGLIFYNLGNFSFASKTRRHWPTRARLYSMIGRLTLRRSAGGVDIEQAELIPLYANNKETWTLEGQSLPARHAEPQLLAGSFAAMALDEFVDFSGKVPGGTPTSFIRVGDRLVVDLDGRGIDDEARAALVERQGLEYQAVLAAGAQPRPATAGELNRRQRAGTPWPAQRPAASPKRRGKNRKVRSTKRRRPKAGKRRSSQRRRR